MADFEWLAPGGHQRLVDNVKTLVADKPDSDALSPLLTAGAALGITGNGPTESAAWLTRTSEADGVASVKSIHGRTLRWNQLNSRMNSSQTVAGLTRTINEDGSLTITGTATEDPNYNTLYLGNTISLKRDGRKYLFKASKPTGLNLRVSGHPATGQGQSFIWSSNIGTDWDGALSAYCEVGTEVNITNLKCMVIDLTAMFGAGNEPSTVAEFEALYGDPYYPYDAGSLLPVQMEGIETNGFNQWDEEWEAGGISTSGVNANDQNRVRSKNYVPVIDGAEYYLTSPSVNNGYNATVHCYDADFNHFGNPVPWTRNSTATFPSGTKYIRFTFGNSSNPVTSLSAGTVCINLSWSGRRNGEYEAFWSSQREIAAATYFPDGMRSAGTVRDELTSTDAITRVGVVDLGTLTWVYQGTGVAHPYFYSTGIASTAAPVSTNSYLANISCSKYDAYPTNTITSGTNGISINSTGAIILGDTAYTDAALLKAALSGVMLHYALATPTTTPIDPSLNLTYRTAAGGTERVMVPTGELSAPPTIVAAQGYTAESLRDAALATIAPVENGKASTNYGIGSYLVHGGQLCKVTTAIATGEAITIGTNVTTTTVMAEVLSLTQ